MYNVIIILLGSGAFAGAFGWIFSLGNRVTILETTEPALKELINVRFDEVNRRLGRIETAMNGKLKE